MLTAKNRLRTFMIVAALSWISGFLAPGIVTTVHAQETSSSIYGSAVDSKGALVPGVRVIAINENTGVEREAVTNKTGTYTIPLLPAGEYTLTAELPGFAPLRITGVTLSVSINSQVQIVLQPSQVTGTVSVAAESNTIDISNATVAASVTNQEVTGLPVMISTLGRSPLSILPFLIPGVTPVGDFSSLGTSNRNGQSMSINGNRTISISYNFEGADNNDSVRGIAGSPFPNPDALQEFTIITNNYQADTGRSSGGVVNAIAKSGTSKLHGNLRYFRIHDSLNARSFFDGPIPRNRLNALGGQLGGPIVLPRIYNGKNRSHFFFDFERTRTSLATTGLLNVLTDLERTGDFSNVAASQRPRDPFTGIAFPGGRIPSGRINPIAQVYLDRFIPRANNGIRGYRGTFQTDQANNQYLARIDHSIGKSDTIFGTFFYTRSTTRADDEGLPLGSNFISNSGAENFVIDETHAFSPSTINHFSASVARQVADSVGIMGSGGAGTDPRDIGFLIHPQTNALLSAPGIALGSINVTNNFTPNRSAKTTWQLKDDFLYTIKLHNLKFGGGFRSFLFNSTVGHNNGNFTFLGSNTFGSRNTIADFLLGIPFSYIQSTGNTMYPRQRAYDAYAMDVWKLKPNLTVNFGLRYELVLPMKDKLDQVSVFRPGQKSARLPNAPTGVLFVGDDDPILGRVRRGGYPADKNNLAPRFGVAFSPNPREGFWRRLVGEQKTAIRAGGGVFYDQPWGGNVRRFQFIQPFSVNQLLSASQIRNAGGTFANPFGSSPNLWPLDLSERSFTGSPLLSVYDPKYRTAYTYQYNLTVQREFPGSLLLNLAYIGSATFKADREREINLGIVNPDATVSDLQSRRTYPAFGSIGSHESTGRARYDSFQVTISRRFRRGLALDVSYWLSKSMDDGSSPEGLGNRFDSEASPSSAYPDVWARSAFDSRHNFVLSYTYSLPNRFHQKIAGVLLNGWQIGGIVQARSGTPLEIVQFDETTLTGRTRMGNPDLVGKFTRINPRTVSTFVQNGETVTGHYLFDPTAFRLVTVNDGTEARPGSLKRNIFNGPGVISWDASIVKRTRVFESHEIELRADISNVLNRASFGFVDLFVDDPEFGQVTAAAPGRVIQLSVRYRF